MKENRELKQKINEWRERFDYLDSEFNKLLQKKEKATTRTQKEITLYTADSDVSYGNLVVITSCPENNPKYEKGFVLFVDHVHEGYNGFKTLYGRYLERDDVQLFGDQKMFFARINNKSYGWKRIDNVPMSCFVKTPSKDNREDERWSYVNDRPIYWHYEIENLAKDL